MVAFFYMGILLVPQICVVPDGLHEYFQHRVQMGYEYEKHEEEDGEYPDRHDLQPGNGHVGEESRYHEREDDEDDGGNESPDVDEQEGEIEVEGDIEIMERHTDRETQGLECLLLFEDDEEACIGEEDIHKKGEPEIDGHEYRNAHKIVFPEYPEEKEIEGYDREEFEYSKGIAELENREEIHESAGNPISETPLRIGGFKGSVLPLGDEGYESSFRNRRYEYIEDDPDRERSDDLPKIGGMDPLYDEREKLVLEFEYVNVRKGDLVEDDTTQVDSGEQGGEEIEFLYEGGAHNQIPGRTHDGFTQCVFL